MTHLRALLQRDRPDVEGRSLRRRPGARRGEGGFTLIEVLFAGLLLTIVAAPLMTVFLAAQSSQATTRERTGADQLASAQIEYVRSLPYDSIGVVAGNPPGVISATPVAKTVAGGRMNVATKVTYVNDPVLGSTPNTFADYKQVVVTVTRATDSKQLSQKTTYVSAPGAAPLGGVDYVTVKSTVIDAVGLSAMPIAGAAISLATGGSTVRSDVSDASGQSIFPALATATYNLNVSMPGYVTLKDDAAPNAPSQSTPAKGTTWNSTIRLYKPSTITVLLKNSSGGTFTGAATVTASSNRGSQSFSASGGTLVISSINGEQVVPSAAAGTGDYAIAAQASGGLYSAAVSKVVPNNYPADLTSTYTLTLNSYTTKTLTVTVKKSGSTQSGATVQVTGGPANTFLTGTANSSGVATFTVPSGSGTYTVSAQKGTASGSATTTVNGSNVSLTVNIS
jgi:type II secretory pathway pseudopilin PulG